jgi:hypothetical protein
MSMAFGWARRSEISHGNRAMTIDPDGARSVKQSRKKAKVLLKTAGFMACASPAAASSMTLAGARWFLIESVCPPARFTSPLWGEAWAAFGGRLKNDAEAELRLRRSAG